MQATLFHGEPNGPSLTALAALFETGQNADLKLINLMAGERHQNPVPRSAEVDMSIEGEGPVFVANGEPMADSVFIACYLNDSSANAKIAPSDAYARWEMMVWCRFIIERVAPAAAYLGVKAYLAGELCKLDIASFDKIVAPIRSEDLKARWIDIRNNNFDDEMLADSRLKISAAVEKAEAQLGDGRDWLLGDFSIADLETFAWLSGMRDIVPEAFAGASNTAAWFERMHTRPSVARALSLATASEPQKVWAPGP